MKTKSIFTPASVKQIQEICGIYILKKANKHTFNECASVYNDVLKSTSEFTC